MSRVNLLGGTYLARSLIASAQACVNLYPEKNPQDASAPYTHQLTPGLVLKKALANAASARGMYTATNGSLYYVAGQTVYFIDQNFDIFALGQLIAPLTTPVFMQDNGNVLVIVDGSPQGYAINLQTGISGQPLEATLEDPGTGGTAGTYSNVELTGGSGNGATATITVAGSIITSWAFDQTGTGYKVGDTLSTTVGGLGSVSLVLSAVGAQENAFGQINDPNWLGGTGVGYVDTFLVFSQPGTRNFFSSLSNITYSELTSGTQGQQQTGAITAGGTGGINGTHNGVVLTGGTGTGATADLTVSGGVVTAVAPLPTGQGYVDGDVLGTSAVPGLTGFEWTVTQVGQPAFDPTYVAGKVGYPDLLATLVVVHREIWLMGAFESTEVWYDAGGANFPFQIMPGVFLQHGCVAPASVQTHDLLVFWLSVDQAGQGTVFMGQGYEAHKISTWAIANTINGFVKSGFVISDAIGMVYKQEDHVFYVLTFPSANATLVYDVTEELWHTRIWTDPSSGLDNRIRANCMAFAYGLNICGDWENGNIYVMDLGTYQDFGGPIVRRRYFPHLLNDGKRVTYDGLQLDMECGNGYSADPTYVPKITLKISDDRGKTYRTAPLQSLGRQGEYGVYPQWRQLGMARDRVFGVEWSEPVFTALQGAWLTTTPSET